MLLQIAPELRAAALHSPVTTSRLRARRRWIVRGSVSLTLSAALIVLIVVLRRDQVAVDDCLRAMSRPMAALQAEVDSLGQLPAVVPDVSSRVRLSYASDLVREYARETTGPVIIASSATRPLVLGNDGNGVLIYQDGKIRCEWWSRVRFVREWHAQSACIREWDQQRRAAPPRLP